MRFLVDENLPYDFVITARESGVEAFWVRDILPGALDRKVLQRLRNEAEVLVTRDVRFANLIFNLIASGENLAGVVLIREQRLVAMRKAWEKFLQSPFEVGSVAVVTEKRIRYHRFGEL